MKNVKIARNDIRFMLGRAGLNVTTNGSRLDSCLVNVSRARLCGIRRTLFISCWMKRCLYSLFSNKMCRDSGQSQEKLTVRAVKF